MKVYKKIAVGNLLTVAALLLVTGQAQAHIMVAGQAAAGQSFVATISVGHGCTDDLHAAAKLDTKSVEFEIPEGVTSVRPMDSVSFGTPIITADGDGNVTAVKYERTNVDLRDGDPAFYQFQIRMKAPDAPFTKLIFLAHQVCGDMAAANADITVDWVSLDGTGEPAAMLPVLPARSPGWNKWTTDEHIHGLDNLTFFFGDALILWFDNAGYSSNAETQALIDADADSTALTEMHPGTEFWVRY